MIQIELTSKIVLAIIGITSVGAILIPTYAVPTIRSADIFNDTILSEDIKDGAVNTVDLANDAVKPNVHIVQGDEVTIVPHQSSNGLVDCPAGEILTGGGFSTSSNAVVRGNFPEDENTWRVLVDNVSDFLDVQFTPYAICIGPSP